MKEKCRLQKASAEGFIITSSKTKTIKEAINSIYGIIIIKSIIN
jgi:hypothetical protein